MLTIKLIRQSIGEHVTDGMIKINGKVVCDTTENSACLMAPGTYKVDIRGHKGFFRRAPTFGNSYLAIGNGVYDKHDGRVLVGKYIAPGCVKLSRPAFMTLFDRIRTVLRRGGDVVLIIE